MKELLFVSTLLVLTGCSSTTFLSPSGQSISSSSAPAFRTYVNEKYAFEMQIPSAWRVSEDSSNPQLFGRTIVFYTGSGASDEGIVIDDRPKGWHTPEFLAYKFDKNVILRITDMTVGGERAERVDLRTAGQTIIIVRHAGIVYRFVTQGPLLEKGVLDSVRFTKEEKKT